MIVGFTWHGTGYCIVGRQGIYRPSPLAEYAHQQVVTDDGHMFQVPAERGHGWVHDAIPGGLALPYGPGRRRLAQRLNAWQGTSVTCGHPLRLEQRRFSAAVTLCAMLRQQGGDDRRWERALLDSRQRAETEVPRGDH
jgi:hypothetical protein